MNKNLNQEKKSMNTLVYSTAAMLLLVILDQATKLAAIKYLKNQDSISLIEGVFELKYLENQSAAFSFDPVSLLQGIFHFSYFEAHPDAFLLCKMAFFIVLTVAVLIFLAVIYRRIPWNRYFLPVNLIMIGFFSGAVGNLADRIFRHYVVDFLYFSLIDFPIFNVADIYVTLAAIGLVIALFIYKEEDFELIFPSKKQEKEKPKKA